MLQLFRSTASITSRFSESAGRNGLHFQKLIREVIFAPVLRNYRPGKFLRRIRISVMTTMFLIILLFSISLYFQAEKIIDQNVKSYNSNYLLQMKDNIDQMDQTIKNICLSTYVNPNVAFFMFTKNPGLVDQIVKIRSIHDTLISVYPFLHSIYIYNNIDKAYYSTFKGLYYKDTKLMETIRAYKKQPPRMTPIVREAENPDTNAYDKVFSYFLYDSVDKELNMEGALIINVKTEWLFNSIEKSESYTAGTQNGIYILDDKEKFILDDTDMKDRKNIKTALTGLHKKNIKGNEQKEMDFVTEKIGGKDYLITYLNVNNANWVLYKVQSYDDMYRSIQSVKSKVILITAIFIFTAFFISLSVSVEIYKPIRKLVGQYKGDNSEGMDSSVKDEILFLQDVHKKHLKQLNLYKNEVNANIRTLKDSFLRKLFLESGSIKEKEFEQNRKQNYLSIDLENEMIVCFLRIDNYKDFIQKYNTNDQSLYKFAIINIASEIVSHCYKNEAIDMKDDQIAMILNTNQEFDEVYPKLKELISDAQELIRRYFNLSVTVALSEKIADKSMISKFYADTLGNSMYRYVVGKSVIITNESVRKNKENTAVGFPHLLEKKLIEDINSGDLEGIGSTIGTILKEISGLNYDYIMVSVMRLIISINDTLEKIKNTRLEPVYIDLNALISQFSDLETLHDLEARIMEIMEQMEAHKQSKESGRHIVLVDAIKQVIRENYFDNGLCSKKIASMIKMSYYHINKIFRIYTHMTISDYMNEVRLEKAVEWLYKSDLSINEILVKIGIENESYFYRLFKKKYGTTPKDYSVKNAIKAI